MAIVERWPLVEIGLLLITERRDFIQSFKVHFVVTAFDCKDENSFGFSLFVDVRFKLCSVLLIWIKHSLLFRNTIEPPLTTTSTQWPFFFLADSPYIHSCFNLSTTATSLQWPLKTVLRNNSLLLESNARPRCFVFFFLPLEIVEPQRKKKKRKKGKAEQGTEAGELIVIQRFI